MIPKTEVEPTGGSIKKLKGTFQTNKYKLNKYVNLKRPAKNVQIIF